MRKLKIICIFVIVFVQAGCGTVITKAGGDIGNTYSGTEFDKNWISCLSSGLTHPNNDIISKMIVLVFMAYPIADLPFSFAADTVFFPIDKVSDEKIEDSDYSFCGLIEEFSG